ncbi:MAG TPA: HAD family hydrolase [Vicinamibacterales bacterium]|nr:HAD family hydrolase [Vicinamibacterales bacterium]
MPTRAVFLDRDGTLIEEAGYANQLSMIKLFPYSVDAVRQLNLAGFTVVVITNQAGISRGIVPEPFVAEAHAHLTRRLASGGATVDAYYYCPHHPDGVVAGLNIECECRKPKAGLWQRAAADLGVDLAASFSVGDRWRDVRAARAAGTRSVMVRTGYGRSEEHTPPPGVTADAIVDNLAAAVGWILASVR